MPEITTFLEIASAEKNCKNSILGINNVDPKPEPNVQKTFFFIIYKFFRGLSKMRFFLEKHFEFFSQA